MKIILKLLFLIFIAVCSNTNLPPSVLKNESPEPKYKLLKRKPLYVPTKPTYICLDSMPKPLYRQAKKGLSVTIDSNYICLKGQPEYILSKQTSYSRICKGLYKETHGKYILAGIPQKIKGIQPATKDNAKQNIKYFSVDQGLPGAFVQTILKDRDGRLWMGTDNGLSVYDGTSFYNYSVNEGLSSNFISCLTEDTKGRIWIGTKEDGINVFDGNGFIHYNTSHGLCSNNINSLIKDRLDRIWIGTADGISVYKENTFTNFTTLQGLNSDTILSFLEDKQGLIWIGTQLGINIYNGEGFSRLTDKKGIDKKPVQSLFEDMRGKIWIGTVNGLNVYDGKGVVHYSEKEGLINDNVLDIVGDDVGSVWIATKEGVNKFDGKGFTRYTAKEGLSTNVILCLQVDDQDQLWMGTMGGGANIIGDYGFRYYRSGDGLNFPAQSLAEDSKGNIWIGTNGGGVIMYNKTSFFTYSSKNGLSSNDVSCLEVDQKNNIWIGTFENGINVYNGKGFIHYNTQQGLVGNCISSFLNDRKGNIWIGTNRGISMYNGKGFINYTTNEGLSNNSINTLFEDKRGNIWIGTSGGGINVFDGNGFTCYTTAEGLSNNTITGLMEDQVGRIWIGTQGGGLCLFDGKGFTYFTVTEGLCNNNISNLVKDSLGRIWVGTSSGLSRFSQNNDSLFTILNYKKRQGLCHLNFNKAVLYDSKGQLWWGTADVLSSYTPPANADFSFPLTHVTELDLMGKPVKWVTPQINYFPPEIDTIWTSEKDSFYLANQLAGSTSQFANSGIYYSHLSLPYHLPENLSLPYDKNWITFHFTGVRFKDVETLRYRYMLEGMEDKLNPITELNEADYRNIPPGKYTFKVYGRCRNAVWSLASEFSFEIREPWWLTTWAYFSYVFIAISLVVVYVKWRTSKLRASKRLLELSVAERTAEINKQKQELERLSIVASETDNVIVIMDADGKVEWVNSSFERVNGISIKEVIQLKGETIFEISNNPNIREIVEQCITSKKSISFESFNLTRDGRSIWESSTLTPIFNAEGKLKKLIIIDTDITERKNAEQIIRQKNKDITDSINYANKIQTSILPGIDNIKQSLPNSFVFYLQKDIVSGDFYWFTRKENNVIIAAIDCTGHGVPGAFMSLIGYSLLNQIVNENGNMEPAKILDELNKGVINALYQNNPNTISKDGMDIAICNINVITNEIQFAGAMRPLYLFRKGILKEIKGDKMSIGTKEEDREHEIRFTNHSFTASKGDTFYICTDGYADQFGGSKSKKMTTKKFKQLLEEIQNKTFEEQNDLIMQHHFQWRGIQEQVDDILVIGISV